MLYAQKRFLVEVDRAEDDGFLDFGETIQPYFKGNIIGTDQYGNKSVLTEDYFHDNYIPVRKMRKGSRKPQKSPFESEYAKAYAQQIVEFGSLPSSEENEEYIEGTRELSKNLK